MRTTGCAGVGAKVARAVVLHPPRDVHTRPFLPHINLEIRIGFIVLETDVESRLVAFDEGVFKDQRLGLSRCDNAIEIRGALGDLESLCAGDHGVRPKVGTDTVAENGGLADIDRLSTGVTKDVDAGLRGKSAGHLGEINAHRAPILSRCAAVGLKQTLPM